MRVLKLALISFIVLFLVITGISLFIPSNVRISRAINMGADSTEIINNVEDIGKWRYWYPGFDTLKIVPVDTVAGKIHGVNVGGKSITITDIKPNEVIARFGAGKGRPVNSGWKAISFANSDSTTVQWYMDFRLRWYPWEKFSSLTFEKLYAPRMEEGLIKLKMLVEN